MVELDLVSAFYLNLANLQRNFLSYFRAANCRPVLQLKFAPLRVKTLVTKRHNILGRGVLQMNWVNHFSDWRIVKIKFLLEISDRGPHKYALILCYNLDGSSCLAKILYQQFGNLVCFLYLKF